MAWFLSLFFISTCTAKSTIINMPFDQQITPPATTQNIDDDLNQSTLVKAGGIGGNLQSGKVMYDGGPSHLPSFIVSRHHHHCYLKNKNVYVVNAANGRTIKFDCDYTDPAHRYLYWDGELGNVNGGYSPENDTLYAIDVLVSLFKDWYHVAPFVDKDGLLQEKITIKLHNDGDAIGVTDNNEIVLGDGRLFYPPTDLKDISLAIGYLFTAQHSKLDFDYHSQSTAISIAFNCMTAMAAEFYATGNNTWQLGSEIAKDGKSEKYFDVPSKDCHGTKPGDGCSIDTLAQYVDDMDTWYASGLFNRAFYLLATTQGWDTHKAYDIFVEANRSFWSKNTDFHQGACGTVAAAKKLGYDTMSVMIAFSAVGIDTRDC